MTYTDREQDLIDRAAVYATQVHEGQERRYTHAPYFTHVAAVANALKARGLPAIAIAAGYLHDSMEDCGVTEADLIDRFGTGVAGLVIQVTDVSRASDGNREVRKELDRLHLRRATALGKSIKLADLADNTISIATHDPDFAIRYLAEKARLLLVLQEGDPVLLRAAYEAMATAYAILANPDTVRNLWFGRGA